MEHGKSGASVKEFYKKNHRWIEGLISAAKAVGWASNILVGSADNVVAQDGKFEELIVASKEIAASTAQLVASSRVKAKPNAPSQLDLEAASKNVTAATTALVKAAKEASSKKADAEEAKITVQNTTLTKAKRLEMEVQVKVLELEAELSRNREKLADLRKVHYHLADQDEKAGRAANKADKHA